MNANEQLRDYNCSDEYYGYTFGLIITEGVKALADRFGCYWFLDIIAGFRTRLSEEEFQVWTLKKHDDDSATVTCTDGNDRVIKIQKIPWTDFNASEATVWVEYDTILLPSEH